jgi:hypothetical protein
MESIHYPYYIYPGYPVSGYTDISTYNLQLLKLNNKINTLKNDINDSTLFHLTIGACMEEYLQQSFRLPSTKNQYNFQWQQLFPDHLKQHALFGGKVIHIIVSPTKSFNIYEYIEPLFVAETSEFEWITLVTNDEILIRSRTYDIQIYIYCTMMPCIDDRNKQIRDILQKNISTEHDYVTKITQTEYDVDYIIKFYNDMKNLFSDIRQNNGIITCFSFAVFCNGGNKSHIKNFVMFKQLVTHIDWNNINMYIGEWSFYNGNYMIVPYTTCKISVYIGYADITTVNKSITPVNMLYTICNDGYCLSTITT